MRDHTDYLWFDTSKRHELINITDRVAEIVAASTTAPEPCTRIVSRDFTEPGLSDPDAPTEPSPLTSIGISTASLAISDGCRIYGHPWRADGSQLRAAT